MTYKISTFVKPKLFDKLELHLTAIIGFIDTRIFLQLIAEYNHAKNNNVNMDEYFLVNIQRLSNKFNVSKRDILNILCHLADRGLIDFHDSGIDNTQIIKMNENRITRVLQICKIENIYCDFDSDLLNYQNPKFEDTTFHKSTNTIFKYVNLHMKNPEKIPMITYSCCNKEIIYYELDEKIFTDDMLDLRYMFLCFQISGFKPIALISYVKHLCEM